MKGVITDDMLRGAGRML